MKDFSNKFRIPTLLGLAIILIGIASGVYLVAREQPLFISRAAPNLTPQNITFSNITDNSIVISWQTPSQATSFISFGQNTPSGQTALDDRDANVPKPHINHYATLKKLLPRTTYQFKIVSGNQASDILKFTTAAPITTQTGFTPVIGSVLDGNTPLEDGFVYLSIQGATTQSSLIKEGSFLIPLTEIRNLDLSNIFQLTEEADAKLTIYSDKGNSNATFKLKTLSQPLPPIKLGQTVDLIATEPTPEPSLTPTDLNKYDLNADGKVNAADYSIITTCFNKKPTYQLSKGKTCTAADVNGDSKTDQKDLDLISQKLKDLGSQ